MPDFNVGLLLVDTYKLGHAGKVMLSVILGLLDSFLNTEEKYIQKSVFITRITPASHEM